MIEVRPYASGDLAGVYDICRLTGEVGEDATPFYDDPDLLGHVYAGPYAVLEPTLAFVAVDADGPAGYVLGARDVDEFGARLEREWWPPLRDRYPLDGRYRRSDRRLVELIHRPPPPMPEAATHPSELHIDLLARCQGSGAGRRLIDTLLDALRRAGSPGVHLGVDPRNERAIGFYRHLGFDEHRDGGRVRFTLALS